MKKYLKTVSIALSLTLVILTAGCGKEEAEQSPISVITAANQEEVLDEVLNAQISSSHSDKAGKEETVYVLADAKGGVNQVIVSEWLKNSGGSHLLADKTSLKDIQNVKGYEDFEIDKDGNLTWQAEGADIYYKGATDKEVPVEVKLSYLLDGKEIEPEELAGKSGRVTIRMDYENKETKKVTVGGKEEEIKVPFAMISGMILPQDRFSNIEVINGRLLSEGNNSVAVGVAFPGLKESIDLEGLKEKASDKAESKELDDLEIPDYIEITADVEDFELGMTMTVAMSDVLSDINLTDSLDLSDLNDSMDELQDASNQLKDGTTELKDGTKELKDGTKELLDGTDELADGAAELKDGTQELFEKSGDLDEGAGKINDGAAALYDGTQELMSGVAELKSGAGQLKDGGQKLAEGTGSLVSGAESLNNGAVQMKDGVNQVVAKMNELKAGIGTPVADISQVNPQSPATLLEAARLLNYSMEQAVGGEETYNAILSIIAQQKSQAQANLAAADENLAQARERAAQAQAELAEACQADVQELTVVTDSYTETESRTVEVEAPVYYTTKIIREDSDEDSDGGDSESIVVEEATDEDSQTFTETVEFEKQVTETDTVEISTVDVEKIWQKVDAYQQSLEEVAACQAEVTGYALQVQAIDENLSTVQASQAEILALAQKWGAAIQYGAAIEQALTGISGELNSEDTARKMTMLVKGAGDLADGTQSALTGAKELNSGARELKSGIDTLENGAGALADGTGSLKDGAAELKNGTRELKEGTEKLVEGTGTLNDGANTLKDGVSTLKDGVLTLDEGAGSLDEGALKLMDGMFEFDEDGIHKLTELFGEDVQDVTDRLKAVADAGKEYNTFTELPEGVDGSVKFVIRTEGVR